MTRRWLRSSPVVPLLSVLAACAARTGAGDEGETSSTEPSMSATSATGATESESSGSSTTLGTETTEAATETETTAAETETTEAEAETETETDDPLSCYDEACTDNLEDYCFPCEPEANDAPVLTLGGPSAFDQGGTATLLCNDCYSWVLWFTPEFGGFTLTDQYVSVEWEVEVEGFNIQDDGLFDSGEKNVSVLCCDVQDELSPCPPFEYVGYDCDEYLGIYLPDNGFIVQPPQGIPDLQALDGQPMQMRLRFTAGELGEQELVYDATIQAPGAWDDCPVLCDAEPGPDEWLAPQPIPARASVPRLDPTR